MEQCKITYYLQWNNVFSMRKEDYFSLCLSNAVESISKVTRSRRGKAGMSQSASVFEQYCNVKEGCCQLRIPTIYCKMYKLSGNLCCCIMDNNFIHLQLILLIVKCSKSPGISTYTQIYPLFLFPCITNFPHTQYEGTLSVHYFYNEPSSTLLHFPFPPPPPCCFFSFLYHQKCMIGQMNVVSIQLDCSVTTDDQREIGYDLLFRIVIVLPRNVTTSRSFFSDFRFGDLISVCSVYSYGGCVMKRFRKEVSANKSRVLQIDWSTFEQPCAVT